MFEVALGYMLVRHGMSAEPDRWEGAEDIDPLNGER